MGKKEEKYMQALEGKKIPVLTLDNKWHQLFANTGTTKKLETLKEKLNELLKRQGKVNTGIKDMKRLKKKAMDEIVTLMNEAEKNKSADKKMEENRRLIQDINGKMEAYEDESLDIPREIEGVNRKLMLETMDICYDLLKENTKEIEEIGQWVARTRVELKKQLLRKQERERINHELYSYMHDIFGSEVIEIFDMQYQPEALKKPEKKEKSETP